MKSNNKNISTPEFNSANLTTAFEDVKDVYENHQNDINAVSDDIKTLETYIRSKNVQMSHQHNYEAGKFCYHIYWDKLNNDSKEYRLLCETSYWQGEYWCLSNDKKPLIEHSLALRVAVYPILPDFLKSLADEIKVFSREKKEQLFDLQSANEIPF